MRDYLSPAKKAMARVLPHPSAIKAFILKRRAHVFVMTATFVVVTTLSFATVRALIIGGSSNETASEAKGSTSTLSNVSGINEAHQNPSNDPATAMEPVASSNTSQSNTSVTVNNQPIEVPKNGTTHKTIVTDDGTTQVTITADNGSINSSTITSNSNSYSSTNTSSSSTSSVTTHDVKIEH